MSRLPTNSGGSGSSAPPGSLDSGSKPRRSIPHSGAKPTSQRILSSRSAAEAPRRPEFGWAENVRNYNSDFIEYVEERVKWE